MRKSRGNRPGRCRRAKGTQFNTVDIFPIISAGEDTDPGALRESALDYNVAFCNSVTGFSSPGIPVIVWAPGWTGATGTDDYVARWTAATPGLYDRVAIEPDFPAAHDEVTEIDAVMMLVPPAPPIPALSGPGLAIMALLLGGVGFGATWARRSFD